MAQAEKFLQRPLYVFDLPDDVLRSIHVKSDTNLEHDLNLNTSTEEPVVNDHNVGTKPATSCGLCGLQFIDVQEQRRHTRSDLHGYNTKQKIRGQKPVSEAEFEELLGQLEESISGSDSTESEESDEQKDATGDRSKETTLGALLKRQAKITNNGTEDETGQVTVQRSGKPPLLWFQSTIFAPNVSLGVYRSIFTLEEQGRHHELVDILRKKQLTSTSISSNVKVKDSTDDPDGGVPLPASSLPKLPKPSGPHYFLCMIGGGHFAAMLVSLTPKLVKRNGFEDRSASVLAHKTFHRYTTRRKQGGSQSANDNSKGNAHSAGSSLRRYNEAALEKDVRDLLGEWKSLIDTADLLFIRATGVSNRKTLYGPYDGQILNNKDNRIRGFPFSTKRATQAELMRAFVELTRVKVSTIDEAALARKAAAAAAEQAAAAAASESNSKTSIPKPPKPSRADEEAAMHTTQLQALIKRSKAPGMLTYIQSNALDVNIFRLFPIDQNHHAPTLLHFAATSNAAACISSLLSKTGADPAIRNEDGKTPFEVAGDRPTRDAFRLARSQLGEERWPWDAAGVASALSQRDADARNARERDEKLAEEASEKQRRADEVERLRREDAEKLASQRNDRFGKGQTIGNVKLTAEERRMEQARGMSDEMRMRMEREKRARAAEERIRRMQNR